MRRAQSAGEGRTQVSAPEQHPKRRVWLCDTWEERDALVRQFGRDRLRITVVEEIDDFDIMQTRYRVELLPSPDAAAGSPPR